MIFITTPDAINQKRGSLACCELTAREQRRERIMSRQDYIMAQLVGTEIAVRPSSRVQRAPRDSVRSLAERLLAVWEADELDADLQKQLALVMEFFNGLGEAPSVGRRAKREKGPSDDLFGMSRC